jgi:rod shape determining protein RodA
MNNALSPERMTIGDKLLSIRWSFLFLVTMVAGVGFVSLYSAAGGSLEPWAGKQMIRFCIGMAGLAVAAVIDIRTWMRLAYPLFGLGVLLLVWVDIKGHVGMGAQRWINLGFMQLQPSELMKVLTVLALARYFSGLARDDVKRLPMLLLPAAIMAVPVGLVLVQPDMGTAGMILFVSIAMFFIAGAAWWLFAGGAALAAAALPVLWQFMHAYQKKRVLTFLDPESDPLGSGYHIMQSKIALGSGGVFGKGFLKGSQSHLDFLPEKQTDFIFTLYTEEWGLAGGLFLLSLFAVLIAYGYVMAFKSQHPFGRLLSMGIIINFSLYVFINAGMVMGLLPVVGVPLPLVSYGGTAMLSLLFGFGLFMSAYVHRDVKFTRGAE